MSSGIAISDMQHFAESLDSEFSSGGLGNVVELGPNDTLGDDFGASLISNARTSSSASSSSASSSRPSASVSALEPITDIGISSLEPLDAISFDLPTIGGSSGSNARSSGPEISITRDSAIPDLFSNHQTATGPSIALSAAPRMSQEEERKKKMELLNKLNRFEKMDKFVLSKHFTMDNSIDEIQEEYDRLFDQKNLESSMRFQQMILSTAVYGIETLNNKYDPLGIDLNGWHEQVMVNMENYDELFMELYDKYKNKASTPPEVRLLLAIVGSGFMFHMSKSFYQRSAPANPLEDILRNNPQLAQQLAAAAAYQAGPGFGQFMSGAMGMSAGSMPPPPPQAQPQTYMQVPATMQPSSTMPMNPQPTTNYAAPQPIRREMRGPSGVDDILKTYQEVRDADLLSDPSTASSVPPPIFTAQPAVQAAAEIHRGDGSHSPLSVMSSETVTSSASAAPRRGGRRKAAIPASNVMMLNL